MFLFIKKSARKHEGKENMKPISEQRGENMVGPLSTRLQLSQRGIIVGKGTARSSPKML